MRNYGPHSSADCKTVITKLYNGQITKKCRQRDTALDHVFSKSCFLLCLHVANISLILFKLAPSGLNVMKYLSVKHSLHCLVEWLKLFAFVIISQDIL